MISKWYKLKDKAIKMRKKGISIRNIELHFGIPRSTLSGWFRNIKLDKKKKDKLYNDWLNALVSARKKAVVWHNSQKEGRLKFAEDRAKEIANKINFSNKETMELALAMLYLGEGFKKTDTGIGNSDPMILIFFISLLKRLYGVKTEDMKCYLHLRADQNPEKMRLYWSKTLKIPVENFGKASIDKRTEGSKTYDSYKGVCIVRCGNVAIQRKLVYLSRIYCEKMISNLGD